MKIYHLTSSLQLMSCMMANILTVCQQQITGCLPAVQVSGYLTNSDPKLQLLNKIMLNHYVSNLNVIIYEHFLFTYCKRPSSLLSMSQTTVSSFCILKTIATLVFDPIPEKISPPFEKGKWGMPRYWYCTVYNYVLYFTLL